MKIINQSVESVSIPDPFLKIEKIARVCTASEDKITETSYKKLIQNCISKGHESIFGHVGLCVIVELDPELIRTLMALNSYLKFHMIMDLGICEIHGNVQAFRHLLKSIESCHIRVHRMYVNTIGDRLKETFPLFFEDIEIDNIYRTNCGLVEEVELSDIYKSFKLITNRAIANQWVRHRIMSFMQSSTRYINYTKKGGLEFIEPTGFNDETKGIKEIFVPAMEYAEKAYVDMLNAGAKPETARDVLPLATATTLYISGFLTDWKPTLSLRMGSSAQEQTQELANVIYNKLKDICVFQPSSAKE